ncbi:hypothetical protein C8R43DRAFT_957996 [Mycena crocata]|nr:hypothetical protein C8R43DRAFT_957996 [Mycena crocata]
MEATEINAGNASDELGKAEKLLNAYKRKNANAKSKMPRGYKKDLEERITHCQRLISEAHTNANGSGTRAGASNELMNGGGGAGGPGDDGPEIPHAASTAQSRGPPDGRIPDAPPAKKARSSEVQRHRKIRKYICVAFAVRPLITLVVIEDPMETITNSISAPMMLSFVNAWLKNGAAVALADPTSTADDAFPVLHEAAVTIMDHVMDVAAHANLPLAQFNWAIKYDGGQVRVSHLLALYDWMVSAGLMIAIAPAQAPPPAAKKSDRRQPAINIRHDGKQVVLTSKMAREARKDPSKYPGCVEAGMAPVLAVLTNRHGNEKCITCHSSAPRGEGLDARPDPPVEDHPFLKDCKCPLDGAALELWMIKMTAEHDDIPRRGDDKTTDRRLALSPDILKIIAGAIEVASGHTVDTLLMPEEDRLEHTALWALKRLHSLAERDNSAFADSFLLLATKLKETTQAILMEDSDSE